MESYITVNKNAIIDNIKYLAKDKKPCLMVKALGYGVNVVELLVTSGYDFFGVSTVSEALLLRQQYPHISILITSGINLMDYETCNQHNITISIGDFNGLNHVSSGLKYHVKLDTGMNRYGFKDYEFNQLITKLNMITTKPDGIFTHFPKAYDQEVSQKQIKNFKEVIDECAFKFNYIHIQNTLGCILYDLDFVNMVRPGIGMYGLVSNLAEAKLYGKYLKDVIKVHAYVIQSKKVSGSVGYDLSQNYDGYLTTIKLGYHDGFLRGLKGFKYLNQYEVIGKVCMCQQMVSGHYQKQYLPLINNNQQLYQMLDYLNITAYEWLVSLSPRLERRIV